MKTHELKCWPEFFLPVQAWKKVFEIRHNDRGFEVGDILWLREWDPTTADYSGESVRRAISYITDFPDGLKDGYVCMGLSAEPITQKTTTRSMKPNEAELLLLEVCPQRPDSSEVAVNICR